MSEYSGIRLNQNQRKAVEHFGSPLIVLAGPGSGKTGVIVHRIAHLIQERNVEPESIIALTFTNKAAEEMRRRLSQLLGSSAKADRVIASTFHSFGLRLIRQFADLAGLRPEPTIIDDGQQRALMRKIIDESGIGLSASPYDPYALMPDTLKFIGACRNHAIFHEDAWSFAEQWAQEFENRRGDLDDEERLAEETKIVMFRHRVELYQRFETACYERGWVTFDDLQTQALRLLRGDDRARAIVRTDHGHLVVDEFQDVNRAQIELLKCLAGPTHDLCVVGDDDQAIYGFRGSIPSGFKHVVEHWPATETIELTQNYRSTAVIVRAADRIISKCGDRFMPDKTLIAAGENADLGHEIEGVTYTGIGGAGTVIGAMIADLVEHGESNWGDVAVLVRTNKQLGRIAATLQAMEIPVDVPEVSEIASHPMVQDILSWLRILADSREEAYLTRLLTRPPFNVELPTIVNWNRVHRYGSAESGLVQKRQSDHDEQEHSGADHDSINESGSTFLEYLIDEISPNDERVQRFANLYSVLATQSSTMPADDLILGIIHSSGLLTLDPVSALEHQSRIEQLGRFLGFARERMPMLEPPRRVRDFIRYFDDLQSGGSAIETEKTPEDQMDSGIILAGADAVRVLTAHKAKGLEFDTVFIPRVNSPHGYPMKGKNSAADTREMIPQELIADESPSAEDDERRIFFVALTRAKKRVVLLAMTKDDIGRNMKPSAYWDDLVNQSLSTEDESENASKSGSPAIPIRVRSADEVLHEIEERRRRSGTTHQSRNDGGLNQAIASGSGIAMEDDCDPVRAARQRAQFRIRHEIYAILHALHSHDLSADGILELQNQLAENSLRLPILAAENPAELETILQRIPAEHRDSMQRYADEIVLRRPWYDLIPAPRAPLTLTYSQIDQYIRCPRCYWLQNVVKLRERSSMGASFGQIVHRTLEFFYKRFQQHEEAPDLVAAPTVDDLMALGRESYREMRDSDEPWSNKMERQIEQALWNYHKHLHSDSINPVYVEQSVTFDYPLGDYVHRIKVRMDRVDFDGGGHHVIDYKTGQPSKTRLEPKSTDLQLGIYLLALSAFLEDDEPSGSAQYWLTRTGERGFIDFTDIKLNGVRKKIDKAIAGILEANWEKSPKCRNCELLAGGWESESEISEAAVSP